jgi:hypothetical protein
MMHQFDPAVVVTRSDNSNFHTYAEFFPEVRFVAIQNGWRFPSFEGEEPPLPRRSKFRSELLCFGQNDIDSYTELGIEFRSIRAVGSLRNSLYVERLGAETQLITEVVDPEFDLCLISQFRTGFSAWDVTGIEFDECVDIVRRLLGFRPHLRIAVAMASSVGTQPREHESEVKYFRDRLGEGVSLFPRDYEEFTVYSLTDRASLSITSSSTAGVEALSRRRKTLITGSQFHSAFVSAPYPSWLAVGTGDEVLAKMEELIVGEQDDDFWNEYSAGAADYVVPNAFATSASNELRSILASSLGVGPSPG